MQLKRDFKIWKYKQWGRCELELDHFKSLRCSFTPRKLPTLHALGDRSHDSAKVMDEMAIKRHKPMEASDVM